MKIKKIQKNQQLELWQSVIEHTPDQYTIAHNPLISKYFLKTFGWQTERFLILEKEELVGIYQHVVIDKKFVSMPHLSYGGIVRRDETYTKQYIFKSIKKFFNCKYFEIRDYVPYTEHYNDQKVATLLSLKPTAEEQLAFFNSNHRRKIRKAYKNNLSVKVSSCAEDMLLFYSVYTKNMLRLGSPPLSKKFFLNLLEYYKGGNVNIFLVYKNDLVIGGAVTLSYHKFMEDCWLSTLKKYNHLYTGIILYWEMIAYAINKEMKIFSFGRSTKDSSLLKFKKHWKPREIDLFFSFSEKKNFNIKKLKILNQAWKVLPESVSNYLGPIISNKLY
tara:strand:+ start:29 stop:1021 length:993 start_codon:yes stop_codon:yes gene_type:complete